MKFSGVSPDLLTNTFLAFNSLLWPGYSKNNLHNQSAQNLRLLLRFSTETRCESRGLLLQL